MQPVVNDKVQQAEFIVHAFGDLLAQLNVQHSAHPLSLLPFEKSEIKQAIQTLLWELDDISESVRDGLTQAYVYLEQFIPDEKVDQLNRGKTAMQLGKSRENEWDDIDEANMILREMKIAMEEALQELRIFLR